MHNYVVTLLLFLEGIENRSFKINITQLSLRNNKQPLKGI